MGVPPAGIPVLRTLRYNVFQGRGFEDMREDGAEETGGGAKKRDLKIGQKFYMWTPVKSRWGVRFF